MEIKGINLDKITIVGHLDSDMSYGLQSVLNEPHVRIKGVPMTGYVEGQFFFYGYEEAVYYCYDELNASVMGKRNFRMEFNPSKITSEQTEWLKDKIIYILDEVGVTRLDIAFDCDFDLSLFDYEFKHALKKHVITGRNGKVETIYFGSRNSNNYYRIYNKKEELKEQQGIIIDEPILWRYEIEMKNADFIEQVIDSGLSIFDDKRIIQYSSDTLSVNDKVMIAGLLAEPDLMGELTKYARTKYRKMMKSLQGNDITFLFKAELDKKKPELIGQINSWRGIKSSVV